MISGESVSEVLGKVLQDMAMMFVDPAALADVDSPEEELFESAVDFRGGGEGTVTLLAPKAVALEVAANYLGIDEADVDLEMAIDAMKELANVTTGQLLTKAVGDRAVFDLCPPTAVVVPSERWNEVGRSERVAVMLADDAPVMASVAVRSVEGG